MTTSLRRPKLLLLDAGNTLVYLDHQRLSQLAEELGLFVSEERLRRSEGEAKRRYEALLSKGVSHEQGWDLHMQVVFESAGLATRDAQQAVEAARREHEVSNLWRKVPEGLPQALANAKAQGLRLAIVSNSEGKLQELLVRVQLASLFELVVDSALEGVRKPDPEIFHRALTRLGVAPKDALYAGDIPAVDVVGARAVGMDAVLIDTLDHYPEYRDAPRFDSVISLLAALGL